MTRTSTFAGLFEVAGTIGGALVNNYKNPGESSLINAFDDFQYAYSCKNQAKNFGILISKLLNYNTPDATYYSSL